MASLRFLDFSYFRDPLLERSLYFAPFHTFHLTITGIYCLRALFFPLLLFWFSSLISRALCFFAFSLKLHCQSMASSKNNPLSSSHGAGSSWPHDSLTRPEGAAVNPTTKGESALRSIFKGHRWSLTVSRLELDSARDSFNILDSVALGLPDQHRGVVEMRGMVVPVALYMVMLVMGLRLPFVRLVCDVLHVFGLAPTQLVPNAWQILMACYVL